MAGSDSVIDRSAAGRWLPDAGAFHGEGAFWDEAIGALRWVDMLAGDVVTSTAADPERRSVGRVAAVVRRREAGGYVVAAESGFVLLDPEFEVERRIPVFSDPDVRMNEGGCDPRGRLFVGSMAYDATPRAGSLYRLDVDLDVSVAMDAVSIPNGLVWTSEGAVALHADTADDMIWRYDYDLEAGTFGAREPFIDFGGHVGSPDGTALDAEGGLWVAMWGGGAVLRFDAEGRHTDTLPLPVLNVTSCAFGGIDGRTLFVTTSRQGRGSEVEPPAGRVWEIPVGVAGAPVARFAG